MTKTGSIRERIASIQKDLRDGAPRRELRDGTPYRRFGPRGAGRYEHVILAERALGRPLPQGAHVHHVDGDTRNNAPTNLVICQDGAFHSLLHVRTDVVRAGGNPNTHKLCRTCGKAKPFQAFHIERTNVSTGLQSKCRECRRAERAARYAKDGQ